VSVYRVTELIGTSAQSWEDAASVVVEVVAQDIQLGEDAPSALPWTLYRRRSRNASSAADRPALMPMRGTVSRGHPGVVQSQEAMDCLRWQWQTEGLPRDTRHTIRRMPMSAEENKAATQAAYQAFGAGDLEGAMKDMADDIEWIEPGDSTISGTYRGKDEVGRFFMTLADKSFRTEPQHFIADGDHVVVLTRITVDGQSAGGCPEFRGTSVAAR